jgi:hypothetical protein
MQRERGLHLTNQNKSLEDGNDCLYKVMPQNDPNKKAVRDGRKIL